MDGTNFQNVALADIEPSKDNTRKIDEKSADFQELVASIKGGGVRVPIQVRVHPKKKRKYIDLFKDVCKRKDFTEPKSWAGLNEDGTPKKSKASDGKAEDGKKGRKAKAAK